ncbi:MAG: hypothetical protein DLM50_02800 [Candidatus Meridianibacter frigidus]|nr:MAG: hypothetical protein DLM50_02800 [Candidatus Eremiobacteraeota bacterium]
MVAITVDVPFVAPSVPVRFARLPVGRLDLLSGISALRLVFRDLVAVPVDLGAVVFAILSISQSTSAYIKETIHTRAHAKKTGSHR